MRWLMQTMAKVAGPIAIVTSVTALAGWISGDLLLVNPFPGVAMKANTAVALAALGLALSLLAPEATRPARRAVGLALCSTVAAFGLLTLLEYVLHVDLAIDEALLREPAGLMGTLPPGRMAPNTALALVFDGTALFLIGQTSARGQRAAQHLGIAACFIAFIAMLGAVFHPQLRVDTPPWDQMAYVTAAVLIVLSAGILCARPGLGVMATMAHEASGGAMARRLLPAAFVVPILLGWLRLRGEQAGLYDTGAGVSITVVLNTALFSAFVVWTAASINRTETQLQHARDELQRANRFRDAIIENIPSMVFVKEAAGLHFVRLNRAGERLLGVSREDLIGRSDVDIFPPAQAHFFQEKDRATLRARSVLDIPEEPIATAGGQRWLHTQKITIVDDDGAPAFLLGISEDITERKRAEESLRKWAKVFEHAGWGVVVGTVEGTIDLMNPAFAGMHGYTVEELSGRPVVDLFAPESRPAFAEELRRAVERGHHTFESLHARKDGTAFPVLIDVAVVRDERGEILHRVVNVQDITERKRAEEELRRAKEMAEATSRELEAFSYSVSHDLRAPLRSIDGFSQALVEDFGRSLPPEALSSLDRVRNAAQRMGQLIDDLLALSRVARHELRLQSVDLSALARSIAARLGERPQGRNVRFQIAEGITARCDGNLVAVVLENLVGNAWKFTSRRDAATIEIGTTTVKDGARAVFVRDDGAGFDMQYAHKLFGAFQRLHGAAEFEGTGIGLATVQRIVNRHGGRVWAEGKVGDGATFYFTLSPDT